jgi:hypothetical protein
MKRAMLRRRPTKTIVVVMMMIMMMLMKVLMKVNRMPQN